MNRIQKKLKTLFIKELYGLRCPHCKCKFFKPKENIGNPYENKCKIINCPSCKENFTVGFNLDNDIDIPIILRLLGYKVINFDHFPVTNKDIVPCECGNASNIIVKRYRSIYRGYLFTCVCSKCKTYSEPSYNVEASIKFWNDGKIKKLKNRED